MTGVDLPKLPDDDALWSPPDVLPPPLADPAPALLNTHEMEWDYFERLVLAMARSLDGASDVRMYGRRGQAQHGLDVIAFFSDRGPTAYQAKRWQAFRAGDLTSAVEVYGGGRRPFNAERLVIAVASEVRDRATLDTLAGLRSQYPNLEIELWDRQTISDRLRDRPEIVRVFFGPATASVFCTGAFVAAPSVAASSVSADAVLRGPIVHLQLGDEVRRAEELSSDNPGAAAAALDHVATTLESRGFAPHATLLRERQATMLRAADDRRAEALVRLQLGWAQLESGDLSSAEVQVHRIAEWGSDAPDEIRRCLNTLTAAVRLRRDFGAGVPGLGAAFDALEPADPHRVEAALLLAEEAVAAGLGDVITDRSAALLELADSQPHTEVGDLVRARIRMCVADFGGGWDRLAAQARDNFSARITALVLARHGRHLVLEPDPSLAVARWREGIERACMEGLNDDAADWLYAVRSVRIEHRQITGDINELHRHALALRAAGSGTLLPEPYHARERGFAYLGDRDWSGAYEALHRYLWRSVVGADWAAEVDAHELLGDLFRATGKGFQALTHYIAAGERKKLEELARSLRDEEVQVPFSLLSPRPFEKVAAFSFIAACADLVVDHDAAEWCSAALKELQDGEYSPGLLGPDPWLAAFNAFGQLAPVSTVAQAEWFLAECHELIPREAGRYRFTDEAQVEALIGIARSHRNLAPEALDQLLEALLTDQRMAQVALTKGEDLLRQDPQRTFAAVEQSARDGNRYAALALIAAGADTGPVDALARQELERALEPVSHTPGVQTIGTGLGQAAVFVTTLTEADRIEFAGAMVVKAEDSQDSPQNRYEALLALRAIARHLPDPIREDLFEKVRPFAQRERETPFMGGALEGANDPLSRFRVSLGETSLWPGGLMVAAALTDRSEQATIVQQSAMAVMRDATDFESNAIASALSLLPIALMTVPVDLLASHPNPWLRCVAVVAWIQRDDEPAEIGERLARDPSSHVRLAMARNVRADGRFREVKSVLENDPRRSIRRQIRVAPT